jgi:hypothetical protein
MNIKKFYKKRFIKSNIPEHIKETAILFYDNSTYYIKDGYRILLYICLIISLIEHKEENIIDILIKNNYYTIKNYYDISHYIQDYKTIINSINISNYKINKFSEHYFVNIIVKLFKIFYQEIISDITNNFGFFGSYCFYLYINNQIFRYINSIINSNELERLTNKLVDYKTIKINDYPSLNKVIDCFQSIYYILYDYDIQINNIIQSIQFINNFMYKSYNKLIIDKLH